MQFYIAGYGGASMMDFEWRGTIRELKNDNKILVFDHSPMDADRMKVKTSTLNLRSAIIWSVDDPDIDGEKHEEVLKNRVGKLNCPNCATAIYVVKDPKVD